MIRKQIGVAGYMGSGKTTCSKIVASHGFTLIDVDREAKLLMERERTIQTALQATFGSEVVTAGRVDFNALGKIAFASVDRLAQLNKIVHPPLLRQLKSIRDKQAKKCAVVVDAALLPLWQLENWFDVCLWVTAPAPQRLQRLLARDRGLPQALVQQRMALQEQMLAPPSNQIWRYIENEGDVAALERSVLAAMPVLWRRGDVAWDGLHTIVEKPVMLREEGYCSSSPATKKEKYNEM